MAPDPLLSLSPLPILRHALPFSFSPASLQHKEASAEERLVGALSLQLQCNGMQGYISNELNTIKYF